MSHYSIHKNHIAQVHALYDFGEHGLSQEDVTRNDRQNFRSAQRLCFEQVQRCIQQLIGGDLEGRVPYNSLIGTLVFLKIAWYYGEIFLTRKATLLQRIKNAGIVCHFLCIWHNYVRMNANLHKSFISREAYRDVLLSSHTAVILI